MLQQFMADLCDGENVNEVEKQLLVGDAGMMPVAPPQERMPLAADDGRWITSG